MGNGRARSGDGRTLGLPALLLAAVAVVLGAAAVAAHSGESAGPVAVPDPGPGLAPPAPDDEGDHLVVLFGDSFSERAGPAIRERFRADPDLRLSVNAFGGTELDTPSWVRGYPNVPPGSTVLILLGTNDVSTDSPAEVEADARAAIDAASDAGAARVVMATVNTTGRPPDQGPEWTDRARAFNDWLRRADADPQRYPRLAVVDWDARSRDRPEWLAFDGIHHSPAGQEAYAAMAHAAARSAADLDP
ncbi:MAG TPA: GDSL-type esterase/lipase family protein [Acidimicrobiales bacterium]